MTYTYKTSGTCSRAIEIETDENQIIKKVRFQGGCNGNTQGVAKLAEGRPAQEVIDLLSGIRCGVRPTSCPDQLAKALKAMTAQAGGES